MERQLAAILAADVVGYSRLMVDDEAATLAALQSHRTELIEPKAAQYHGRVVKLMGDGVLLAFASVVDAVLFAVDVQVAMQSRNMPIAEDRRLVFRIGINLGDVIAQDDDLYGDGVNIAARLEGLAPAGGICLSRSARDQIRDKLDLGLEDLGEIEVKNIARPVRAFQVVFDDRATALATPVEASPAAQKGRAWQVAAFAAVILLAAAVGSWWMLSGNDIEPAAVDRMAFALPDKPSVAVLPFDNMSNNAEQDYFADGLTDDLITDLSKLSGLFVIARNSTFAYKGRAVKVQQVAEELGVRYVVEGSVRRAGDTVRINAQLIDALTGHHIWAERYDGTLADVFALQDKVIGQIIAALAVKLPTTEQAHVGAPETAVPAAYDAFLRGLELYHRYTPETHKAAIAHFERATTLDPAYARAYAGLAAVYWAAIEIGWEVPMALDLPWQDILDRANDNLAKALAQPSPLARQVSAQILLHQKRYDDALAEIDEGIALDPNDADSYIVRSNILHRSGKHTAAEAAARTAMRFNPHYRADYLGALGRSLFGQERFAEAAAVLERAVNRGSGYGTMFYDDLAATYGFLGRIDEAKVVIDKSDKQSAERGWVPMTLGFVGRWITFNHPVDMERVREGLRRAGVPEGAAPLEEEKDFLARVVEKGAAFDVDGAAKIDLAAARKLFDQNVLFVDVRSVGAHAEGHIPGSIHLDLYADLNRQNLEKVVRSDEPVVFYCFGKSCYRSAHACAKALNWGFTNVYYFADGFPAWKAAGYRVATKE